MENARFTTFNVLKKLELEFPIFLFPLTFFLIFLIDLRNGKQSDLDLSWIFYDIFSNALVEKCLIEKSNESLKWQSADQSFFFSFSFCPTKVLFHTD